MVYVEHDKSNPLTACYSAKDIGFVYSQVWYTDIDNETVVTTFAHGDFYKSGFWANHDRAEGHPVIVKESEQDVLLIGLRAGFS